MSEGAARFLPARGGLRAWISRREEGSRDQMPGIGRHLGRFAGSSLVRSL